jgi:protein-tyrosine phosphatase
MVVGGRKAVRHGPGPMTGEWAPSRHVALDGAVNVRDIGGYRIVGGPEVVRGRLFRGDSLSQLTRSDLERLDRLGLRTVVDFRTPGEVLLAGADQLPFAVEYAHLPVSGGDLGAIYELIASGDHERQRRELGGGRAASFMVEMNRGFVADARQREAFGAALRLLCSPGRLPLLYHCTGGKDRAGWMTAIVLTALGVPRELVLRDYLLSNDFHRTGYQKLRFDLVKTGIVADPELVRPVLELSPTYLGAAFEEADRQYGSFGRFLAYGLEVSEAMLTGLRRAVLGDLVPPEPVPLPPGPHPPPLPPTYGGLLTAARAEGAQLDVREQREDHREPGHDAHVAEPVRRCLGPQRVDGRRLTDLVEVHGARRRGQTPARRRDHRELLESHVVGQRYHVAGQDDLDHGEQHQEGHRLLRRADEGRHEQAQAHRGDGEQGDAQDQL